MLDQLVAQRERVRLDLELADRGDGQAVARRGLEPHQRVGDGLARRAVEDRRVVDDVGGGGLGRGEEVELSRQSGGGDGRGGEGGGGGGLRRVCGEGGGRGGEKEKMGG